MRFFVAVFLALSLILSNSLYAANERPQKSIKLIVIIVIDGLPYRQMEDNKHMFRSGLKKMMTDTAWMKEAYYPYASTTTCGGHATIATGLIPKQHGIIGNGWYSSESERPVYCVEDSRYEYLDEPMGKRKGTAPTLLKSSTLSDHLKKRYPGSKSFGISFKDRAAMMLAGKSGVAYFYSPFTGRYITSNYYSRLYPKWLEEYHADKTQDTWFANRWDKNESLMGRDAVRPKSKYRIPFHIYELGYQYPHGLSPKSTEPDKNYYIALARSPYANFYLLDFAKKLILEEKLGQRISAVDFLGISFSAHDYINHLFGPESLESIDDLIALDDVLGQFLDFLDNQVGKDEYLLAFTADHGFTDSPENCLQDQKKGQRIDPSKIRIKLNQHLHKLFGEEKLVKTWSSPMFYFDREVIKKSNINLLDLERESAKFLKQYPGIYEVYTRSMLKRKDFTISDKSFLDVQNSWDQERGGDLYIAPLPCWYLSGHPYQNAATHGTYFSVDQHVPVAFLGKPFIAGRYEDRVSITDIAPTLSNLIGFDLPDRHGKPLEFKNREERQEP